MDSESSARRGDARRRLWLLLVLGALGLALIAFGARFHPIEEAGTAERDGFVAQADLLLAGEVPRDAFRPLLYPLTVAALAPLVGDTFTAARLCSNLAAVALVLLAFAFARQLVPERPAVAWWALALLAVNPNLWILGQHVSTDMFFAALGAASLLLALRFRQQPTVAMALALGAGLGLAAFSRGSALFLVPPVLWALWSGRHRPALWGWACLAFGITLAPHFGLRFVAFGDPFHDENWKNLAFKLYGYPDWSYLERVPFSGLGEVLLADPLAVLWGGMREAARFLVGGLKHLLGTPLHGLLLGLGMWAAWRRSKDRPVLLWLLFAIGIFLAGLCFTFFAWGRLVLPLLPILVTLSACAWWLAPGGRRWPQAVGVALVLLLAIKTFAFRLPAFVERHPAAELAMLQRLALEVEPGRSLAGTMPFAGRDLTVPYVALPDALGQWAASPAYYQSLAELCDREAVDYLVISALELRQRPAALLSEPAPVSWLEAVQITDGVAAWRVRRTPVETESAGDDPEGASEEKIDPPRASGDDLL
ncbi:MAG: glycosyltransferase family 39 protein [Acidobacteriota bacterium]